MMPPHPSSAGRSDTGALARIEIRWPRGHLVAELDDTPTARALLGVLPVESMASTWGEEVYFAMPVRAVREGSARQVVAPGTVCFWVEGDALALPFGPTPLSRGSECRLVTAVNVVGRIIGDDARILQSVCDGDTITVLQLASAPLDLPAAASAHSPHADRAANH